MHTSIHCFRNMDSCDLLTIRTSQHYVRITAAFTAKSLAASKPGADRGVAVPVIDGSKNGRPAFTL